jgi:hypothetical protein
MNACNLLVLWPHLKLLKSQSQWQWTHQLSYLGSAWIVPCCTISLSRTVFSASDPSQMWIVCGSHSDVVSWMYARTCTSANGDRTGVQFNGWLLGRMIQRFIIDIKLLAINIGFSRSLLGITCWDRARYALNF